MHPKLLGILLTSFLANSAAVTAASAKHDPPPGFPDAGPLESHPVKSYPSRAVLEKHPDVLITKYYTTVLDSVLKKHIHNPQDLKKDLSQKELTT
jgi:hypothetical protein